MPAATVIESQRDFPFDREQVFRAFAEPGQLARWWGPAGFRSEIHVFELRPGGLWRLTLVAPDGTRFENVSRFERVEPPARVVFVHEDPVHRFRMTLAFAAGAGGGTRLTWHMDFADPAEADRVRAVILAANEQNFDRLQRHLESEARSVHSTMNTAAATPESERQIVLAREFDAPRELVWEAMTDPQHVVNWWGPRGFTTQIETMDVRVGGAWKHTMIGPDGARYPNKSIFREVTPPERIVYSHGGGREDGPGASFIATWLFEALAADRTRVTLRMVFPSREARDFVVREFGAIEGGKQTLERLGEHLARRR